jgi:RimJ/RimL family protein N-acetyltransferase
LAIDRRGLRKENFVVSGDPEASVDFGRVPGTVPEVCRLGFGEGVKIRALRLSALSDAPYAFGSSFEREAKYPPEHWDALAEQSAHGEQAAIFIAVERMQWMGMTGCHIRDEDPSTAIMWGMWVDSSIRRRGGRTELLKAAMDWAASCCAW